MKAYRLPLILAALVFSLVNTATSQEGCNPTCTPPLYCHHVKGKNNDYCHGDCCVNGVPTFGKGCPRNAPPHCTDCDNAQQGQCKNATGCLCGTKTVVCMVGNPPKAATCGSCGNFEFVHTVCEPCPPTDQTTTSDYH